MRRLSLRYKSMSRPAKAAVWFVVCNVVNKGISLLATPILTRIMSPEQYGSFSVFQSWVAIFAIFCTLNLYAAAFNKGRFVYEGEESALEASLLALALTITASFFALFCFAPDVWSRLLGLSPFLVALVFVEIAAITAFEFWAAQQRFAYKYQALVILTIAINVVSLCAGIAAILNTDAKVEARVVMDVLAKGVPGLILGIMIFAKGRCFFNKKYWKYGLAFTLPLVPHFLSHFVLNQSDRLMISQMVGNDAAAFYSVSYSIAMAMVIVANAINDSYTPYTFEELSEKRTEGVSRNGHFLLALVAAFCLIMMAFGPEILAVFAGPEYAEAAEIIPPLSASVFFIFLYSLFSNVEYFYEKTSMISVASIMAATLNIALNLIAIPRFGYMAAAWTTLASYMALSFVHWFFYSRICKGELGANVYKTSVLLLSCAAVIAMTFGMLLFYNSRAVRYAVVLAVGLCMYVKRDQIKSVIGRRG